MDYMDLKTDPRDITQSHLVLRNIHRYSIGLLIHVKISLMYFLHFWC